MPEPQVLMTGIAFGESPRWHDGRLWFVDWIAQEVIAIDTAGTSEVMLRVPSMPACIDWTPQGRLLVVSGGEQALLRQEPDGSLTMVADLAPLSRHPWNEVVVDGQGNAYVNGIGYDMMGGGQPAPGMIAVVRPDGTAKQVADGIEFPNGMVVTPDGSTLIVAESHAGRLTAFTIDPDGGLSRRRVWADLDGAAPDGICLDGEGAVWYADVPNKTCQRVAEGGAVLATVDLDRGCFSCALGGENGRTLFLVATEWGGTEGVGHGERTGQVLTITAPAPAAGWPA